MDQIKLKDEDLEYVIGGVAPDIQFLKTLKDKVINAANDTNTDVDRASIQKEIDQSIARIDDNALLP